MRGARIKHTKGRSKLCPRVYRWGLHGPHTSASPVPALPALGHRPSCSLPPSAPPCARTHYSRFLPTHPHMSSHSRHTPCLAPTSSAAAAGYGNKHAPHGLATTGTTASWSEQRHAEHRPCATYPNGAERSAAWGLKKTRCFRTPPTSDAREG